MSRYDVIIRGGQLVLPDRVLSGDLAITDGRIVGLGPELSGTGKQIIDASGLAVLPGVIDTHVHFNEPGRTDWEGFATGTAALAAGGTTLCFDMPLNSTPPTLDAASFRQKELALTRSAIVDVALWGGLVPGNLENLEELAASGAVGFKAFMADSGIDDFPAADDLTLYEGMVIAARLGRPVAVHAENNQITAGLAQRAIAEGRTGIRDYLASRPVVAELEAISRAILFAEESGCMLHIVHVSSGRGVSLVVEAQARGVDVTCETCPHYLVLTDEDVERIGAAAKCAPPLRPKHEQSALWDYLCAGNITFVASDHSPAPASLKTDTNFFAVWGGISGCQLLLPLLLSEGYGARQIPLPVIAEWTAHAAARRFELTNWKGKLEIGQDADLALVDLGVETPVEAEDLRDRHQFSPYIGMSLQGQIVRTLVRGITVYAEGKVVGMPGTGQLVRPAAMSSL